MILGLTWDAPRNVGPCHAEPHEDCDGNPTDGGMVVVLADGQVWCEACVETMWEQAVGEMFDGVEEWDGDWGRCDCCGFLSPSLMFLSHWQVGIDTDACVTCRRI